MIKRRLGLVDMHQDEGRAFYLFRSLEPQTLREPFDKSGLPASELPFQAKDPAGFKVGGESFRELDRPMGRCRDDRLFLHVKNVRNLSGGAWAEKLFLPPSAKRSEEPSPRSYRSI